MSASRTLQGAPAHTAAEGMPHNGGLNFEFEAQPRGRRTQLRAVVTELELPELPYVRASQRAAVPPDRRSRWLMLALVLLAHLLVAWLAYLVLRPAIDQRRVGHAIAITLIEPAANLPPAPPLVPPPPLQGGAPPPRAVPYVPPAKGAIQAEMQGVQGPPLELYNRNGAVRLPPPSSAPLPGYRTPELPSSHIYSGKSPITYKPTRFNNAWAPLNQTLGDKVIEKAIDKTTLRKTVRLPGGAKLDCEVSPLLALAGGLVGCAGQPPPPRPANDDDIRLSMPPATTLTGKKVPLPASAASAGGPPASR